MERNKMSILDKNSSMEDHWSNNPRFITKRRPYQMTTQTEIIEMARQAGFSEWVVQTPNDLIAFAKLVAAKEREKFFTKHEAEELLDATDFSYQNNVTVEMYRKVMAIAERESKV